MKRKSAFIVVAASAAFMLAGWHAPAQAVTLKVTSCLARNHDQTETFFATYLKPINAKKSGLTLNFLGGPEVTPRKKQAPALKRGLIDAIICPTPYYAGLMAEAGLPGLHRKTLEEMRANGAYDLLQEAWRKGLNGRILAWPGFEASRFYIYTKFKPTFSTKTGLDLHGVKMRSTGFYNAFFKAMGATPIVISPGDVYSALERGVVQGMAWPRGSVGKYGWQRFLKYRIGPKFFGSTYMLVINLDKYNGLSQAHKDLLNSQARIYEHDSDAIMYKKADEDDAKLKAAGIEFIDLEGATGKAFLDTIYGSKWAANDKKKYLVDYKTLKAKMGGPSN